MPLDFGFRNHVDFDWRGKSISKPPGLEVALFVRGALAVVADIIHIFAPRAEYGWEFVVRIEGTSLLIVTQEVERWLVIIDPLGGLYALARRWRGGDRDAALDQASRAVHAALLRDGAFSNIRWYTWDEFNQRFDDPLPGSLEPGRV